MSPKRIVPNATVQFLIKLFFIRQIHPYIDTFRDPEKKRSRQNRQIYRVVFMALCVPAFRYRRRANPWD